MNVVEKIPEQVKIQRVLLSVFDKTGLVELVEGLLSINPDIQIYSTGGTYKATADILGTRAAKSLIQVADYTGQPEMQGGLVKTLDYKIYLGLLSEPVNPAHDADLARVGAINFDLTVVNLYPFVQASTSVGTTLELSRSYIDIGGPTMLRASAKNFLRVTTLIDPQDYSPFLAELQANQGSVSLETRLRLAQKVFSATAAYDSAISIYLSKHLDAGSRTCYTLI